jgi:lipopolysaccharide export system ATP-binding protein
VSVLRATHLAKSYRKRQVISDLSVEVESGQIVGLLGPNGAGKTTAFYMIVGLVPPDKGTVTIDDRDITHLAMHQRAHAGIGYLPQEASVFRKLTVEDNVMAILETRDLDETARQERLEQILGELRIAHVRKSLGMALSGGERRRVEIARALAAEPRFVLLDEPFAGVDPLSVIDIQRIMHELTAKGLGVLVTDHNVRETLGVCQRGYVFPGTVMASGTPEEIRNPNREVMGQFFAVAPGKRGKPFSSVEIPKPVSMMKYLCSWKVRHDDPQLQQAIRLPQMPALSCRRTSASSSKATLLEPVDEYEATGSFEALEPHPMPEEKRVMRSWHRKSLSNPSSRQLERRSAGSDSWRDDDERRRSRATPLRCRTLVGQLEYRQSRAA